MKGNYTAPDGWTMTWDTQRPDCPERRKCRHDCGHPGTVEYFQPDGTRDRGLSGMIGDVDISRWLAEFKAEHTGQMELFA